MNEEIKAKVASLYYGQEVYVRYVSDRVPVVLTGKMINNFMSIDYLSLRQISSLTDDECVVIGFLSARHFKTVMDHYGKRFTETFIDKIWIGDYLRSISIALPVTVLINNIPVTFSVEQLVDMGVIKLR